MENIIRSAPVTFIKHQRRITMEGNNLTHGIKLKDKIGYAMGDMGGLLTFSLVSSFLNMFYTDSLGISPMKVSILMIVARIWDAINDPMWGSFIDSRKPTKHGRFRPYILGASVPLAISAVLMFTKLPGLTENQYLLFAYISYIFFGMMYTGTNIPYGSLASVITDDEIERSSLSMWRSIGAGFGGLPAQIILPLVVYYSTTVVIDGVEKQVKHIDSTKMFIAVLILAVLTVIVYYAHFKLTKERITLPPKQKAEDHSVRKSFGALAKNGPFVSLCVVSMLLIAFQMYTQTNYNYLLTHYYNQPGLYSVVTVATYLPMAMFIPFMGKIIRRFGKKEICSVGLAFAAVINFIMFFIGFTPLVSNVYVFLILVFFSGAGQTFLVLEIWALVMDVIDYHEFRSGRREEGTSYSVYSFARKLGHTLAGFGTNALLALIGYETGAEAQSTEVLDKLYTVTTLVPAIVLAIMFIVLNFCYKLSKNKLEEFHEARDAAAE